MKTFVLASLAAFALAAGTASAAPPPLEAAREALALSDARLEPMDEVMASKWFSRAPIQDPIQIEAAKEVQLGWGSHWLYYGAPAGMAAPDLTQLRAQLSEISERIVVLLPRLVPLAKLPDARVRVSAAAAKILRVRYLSATGRAAIVDALLAIRRSG